MRTIEWSTPMHTILAVPSISHAQPAAPHAENAKLKQAVRVLCLCLLASVLAAGKSFGQVANPLLGAWELIHGKYGLPDTPSERNQPEEPFQLKVFSPGHFAYIAKKRDGSFDSARAGTYRIEGNKYIETHGWISGGGGNGLTATFDFRIAGDTLYMSGPTKIVDANGEPMKGVKQMIEVRRRAK